METPAESEKILETQEMPKAPIDNPLVGPEKKQLDKAIAQIIEDDLSTEQKTQQIAQIIQVSQEFFSGPLPHPQIMEGYQKILPSAPERIFTMAEKQLQHRIEMENGMLAQNERNIANSKILNILSQAFAFILVASLIAAGFLLTCQDYQEVGKTIFRFTIVGVAGVFITGKLLQKRNDSEDKKSE